MNTSVAMRLCLRMNDQCAGQIFSVVLQRRTTRCRHKVIQEHGFLFATHDAQRIAEYPREGMELGERGMGKEHKSHMRAALHNNIDVNTDVLYVEDARRRDKYFSNGKERVLSADDFDMGDYVVLTRCSAFYSVVFHMRLM